MLFAKRMGKCWYLIVVLMITVLLAGCASGKGNQTATPQNQDPEKDKQVAEKHAPAQVNFFTTKFGSAGYTMTFAVADLLNKNHAWIKANAVETLGTMDGLKQTQEPANTKNSVSYYSTVFDTTARQGLAPMTKPADYKALFSMFVPGYTYATLDPEIKTGADLAGKVVNTGTPAAFGPVSPAIVDAWGVKDKLKKEVQMQQDQGKDGLSDGTVNASLFTWVRIGNDKWSGSPALQEVLAKPGAHMIDISKDVVDKVRPQYPEVNYLEAPPGAFGAWQTQPIGLAGMVNGLVVHSDFSEDLAYEIVKTAMEHRDQFPTYHAYGQNLLETNNFLLFDRKAYHPGAIKYFKEKGLWKD